MEIIGIIPARYGSTRLPGKPLADIHGKPMIQWVYEGTSKARNITECLVATDDERIYEAVKKFGGEVVMTSSDCRTGTDRVAEAAKGTDGEIIVNIQGDEPMIEPDAIDAAIKPFFLDDQLLMGTLIRKIGKRDELENPNIVRVVIDKDGFALYFTRAAIPYYKDIEKLDGNLMPCYSHIGLYVYRREFLFSFASMESTDLENTEGLEQLRALENGIKIKTVLTEYRPVCVDTTEDLEQVRNQITSDKLND